jgi:hypothetical protein
MQWIRKGNYCLLAQSTPTLDQAKTSSKKKKVHKLVIPLNLKIANSDIS